MFGLRTLVSKLVSVYFRKSERHYNLRRICLGIQPWNGENLGAKKEVAATRELLKKYNIEKIYSVITDAAIETGGQGFQFFCLSQRTRIIMEKINFQVNSQSDETVNSGPSPAVIFI